MLFARNQWFKTDENSKACERRNIFLNWLEVICIPRIAMAFNFDLQKKFSHYNLHLERKRKNLAQQTEIRFSSITHFLAYNPNYTVVNICIALCHALHGFPDPQKTKQLRIMMCQKVCACLFIYANYTNFTQHKSHSRVHPSSGYEIIQQKRSFWTRELKIMCVFFTVHFEVWMHGLYWGFESITHA